MSLIYRAVAGRPVRNVPLPVFAGFFDDYAVKPTIDPCAQVWWRTGDPTLFTEFTFDPNYKKGEPYWRNNPQMTGGRGSGWTTGQYSYGTSRDVATHSVKWMHREELDALIPVPAARKPLLVGVLKRDEAVKFQEACISLLRFASELARIDAVSFPRTVQDPRWKDLRGYAKRSARLVVYDIAIVLPYGKFGSFDDLEQEMLNVCRVWRLHKQVHPMNILLARMGYDGIQPVREAVDMTGGTYGCVRFPPTDHQGRVIDMVGVGRMMRPKTLNTVEAAQEWHKNFWAARQRASCVEGEFPRDAWSQNLSPKERLEQSLV